MSETTKIRVGLGFTYNVGNFQSLRVDVAIEDWRREGETTDEGFERVYSYVEAKLLEKVEQTRKEIGA